MKRTFAIVIGFLHDFAAGCWAATVLAVYWLDREQATAAELAPMLRSIQERFFFIGCVCIALVLVTGAGRTFTYAGNVYGEPNEALRRRLLVVKHLVLFAVFGLGAWWQYALVYR